MRFLVRTVPSGPLPWIVALLLGSLLFGCGPPDPVVITKEEDSPPLPSVTEAQEAVDKSLQAFNNYCVAPRAQRGKAEPYPISLISPKSDTPPIQYRELSALSEVGLLDTTVVKSRQDLPLHRFDLTTQGRQTQQKIIRGRSPQPMFCYAIPSVTSVDTTRVHYHSGPNPMAEVSFSYQYQSLSWAKADPVRRAFEVQLPSQQRYEGQQLLMRVDSTWVDRRLMGYDEFSP